MFLSQMLLIFQVSIGEKLYVKGASSEMNQGHVSGMKVWSCMVISLPKPCTSTGRHLPTSNGRRPDSHS